MLDLSNAANNVITLLILFGFGYIIYSKWKGDSNNTIKNLFSKAKEIVNKTNLKGGGGSFGK